MNRTMRTLLQKNHYTTLITIKIHLFNIVIKSQRLAIKKKFNTN